jgi:hypothetical protein
MLAKDKRSSLFLAVSDEEKSFMKLTPDRSFDGDPAYRRGKSGLLLWRICGMNLYQNTHMYVHTFIHTYIHTCIHSYMHTYIHTYIHTYRHTEIQTYRHTDRHTYRHTYRSQSHKTLLTLFLFTRQKNNRYINKMV